MIEWDPIKDWLVDHGTRIGVILVLGFVLWFALRKLLPPAVRVSLDRSMSGESEEAILKTAKTLASTFMWVVRLLILMMVTFMILNELEVPIGPVLAGFGIAGIAVGFGAQYLIRDLIAGIFVVLENQYRVGDVARIADVAGLVEEINLRKTVLRDLDGIVHHIPNGEIRVASNFTRKFSRANLNISVAYDTDLDHAIDVINRVGKELAEDEKWREVILTPPQVLRVDNLGDSGIDIKVLGDVKPIQQWAVMGELRLRLKRVFDEEGIEIPWPHMKVYFGEDLRLSAEERFTRRAGSTGPGEEAGRILCGKCGRESRSNYKFCPGCGAKLAD
jgi:small conductance mechanosensitive channel